MKFGLAHLQNFSKRMEGNFLSILKNATKGCITYYVGDNPEHTKHLKECTLICKPSFNEVDNSVELIKVEDPQLYFYKLSKQFKEDYLENNKLIFNPINNTYVHEECKIGENVKIGPGSVIGKCEIGDNVVIHANVTIYSKTKIEENVIIESNTVIGPTGVMWVWDKNDRVYLEQLGSVLIEKNCRIGSLVEIVRGSANETTIVGEGTCIAHGCLIGHGNVIGKYNHFANGVKLGGSVIISDYNFLGSGSVVSPGCKFLDNDIIIGSGGVVVKDINEEGVYVGVPVKRIKSSAGKLSGIPTWRK